MNTDINNSMVDELYHTMLKLKTVEDCKILFEDLCTFKEVEQMAQRISTARLLIEGNTYEEVISKTGISSATLSRVSKCVQHGSGGYTKFCK